MFKLVKDFCGYYDDVEDSDYINKHIESVLRVLPKSNGKCIIKFQAQTKLRSPVIKHYNAKLLFGSLAGVTLLSIVIILGWLFYKRKKKERQQLDTSDLDPIVLDNTFTNS